MKILQVVLRAVACLAAIAVSLAGLEYIKHRAFPPPGTTTVVVLRDVTDTFGAQPDVGELLELFDRSAAGRWNGARFFASTVSDVSFNRVAEASLPAASPWLSNELQRAKDVKQFQGDVASIVELVSSDQTGRSRSSVYLAIASHLVRLNEDKPGRKVLVVYSDLMENSLDLSMYDAATFQMLQNDAGSIATLLEGQQALPSLDGVEIHLVHQPTDADRDKQFRVVSRFYRDLLEGKGARVHVSANLN